MVQVYKINASAGSGKTYNLTRRFLKLLANSEFDLEAKCSGANKASNKSYNFSEIMAVTFTNLAANEMKERVIGALKKIALKNNSENDDFTEAEALRALDYIFRHYGALNIKTIDSLLQQLVRLSALELEISPEFESTFFESTILEKLIYEMAIEALHDEELQSNFESYAQMLVNKSQYFNKFFYASEFSKKLMEVTKALITKESAEENITIDYDFTAHNSIEYFQQKSFAKEGHFFNKVTKLEELQDLISKAQEKMTLSAKTLQELIILEELEVAKNFSKFFIFPLGGELKSSVYSQKESFEDCILKNSPRPSEHLNSQYETFKNNYLSYDNISVIFEKAKQFYCLFELGIYLEEKLWQREKSDGILLSSRIASLVKKILSHEYYISGAFCRLGSRLQHILLDEFQDTNREQWQALSPLAKEIISVGGSIFFVGDVKQAIYGWRGGDYNLFHLAPEELKSLANGFLQSNLEYNRRSSANIIAWNNAFFKLFTDFQVIKGFLPLFLSEKILASLNNQSDFLSSIELAATKIATTYEFLQQNIPEEKLIEQDGLVQIHHINLPAKNAYLGALAIIATAVEELHCRYEWQDICVLTLTNRQAEDVAALLMAKNIPVISQGSLLLCEQTIIKELIAFMRFLANPYDDLAFFELLLSKHIFPYNLIEEHIFSFVADVENKPLFLAIKKHFPQIWDNYFKALLDSSALMTAYDTLNEIYSRFQVLEKNSSDELFLQRLLELVYLAEKNGYMELTSFLKWWDEFNTDEKAPLPQNINAVKVMTVHKAKGLEFEAVLIPFVELNAQIDRDKLDFIDFYHEDKKYTVYSPFMPQHGQAYFLELFDNVLEKINNLYVAFTRPRQELHIFMMPNDNQIPKRGINSLWSIFTNRSEFGLGMLENNNDKHGLDKLTTFQDFSSFGKLPQDGQEVISPMFLRFLEYLLSFGFEEFVSIYNNAETIIEKALPHGSKIQEKFLLDFAEMEKGETVYFAKLIQNIYKDNFTNGKKAQKEKKIREKTISRKIVQKCDDLLHGEEISSLQSQESERPMFWLPRLKILRKDLQELYNYPSLSANKRGVIIHKCLENLTYSGRPVEDAKRAIQNTFGYFAKSLMNKEEIDAVIDKLTWFLNLKEPYGGAQAWLNIGLKEHSLVSSNGNIYRVDLLLPINGNDGQQFLAIDYKTGYNEELPNKNNINQMKNYLKILQEASNAENTSQVRTYGLLIYLDRKEIFLLEDFSK